MMQVALASSEDVFWKFSQQGDTLRVETGPFKAVAGDDCKVPSWTLHQMEFVAY